MKNIKMILAVIALAAITAVSACKAGETAKDECFCEATANTVQALETNPDPYADDPATISVEMTAGL